jgi:hypothetical protein
MQFHSILLVVTSFPNTNPSVMPRDKHPNAIAAARGGRGGNRVGVRLQRGPPPQRLTVTEQEIVRRALQYWDDDEHWDFECPTLFGFERSELQSVLQSWPLLLSTTTGPGAAASRDSKAAAPPTTSNQKEREQKERLAAIGALRELLLGASTAPKSQIPRILGVNYDTACRLLDKVLALYTYNNN